MTKYFKHGIEAAKHPELKSILHAFGYEGYGLFWHFVELLHQNEGILEYDKWNTFLESLQLESMSVYELLNALIAHELLKYDDDKLSITFGNKLEYSSEMNNRIADIKLQITEQQMNTLRLRAYTLERELNDISEQLHDVKHRLNNQSEA